jgi:hypothetical protein
VVAALVSLTGVLLASSEGMAHADRPTVINEDNTGFACEYFPGDQPQISVSINYDAVTGEGSSFADVLTPDGELHLANGFTDDVTISNGVVAARYPLTNDDGSNAGEVVLEGTYGAIAEPVTLRNRFRYAR